MFDIVFPRGNEKEFMEMAVKLGYSGLVFVYADKRDFFEGKAEVKVKNALLVPSGKISKARAANALAFCSENDARPAIERGADVVFGMEQEERKDKTHYRRSGLNQVLCKLAARKGVAVGFSLQSVLSARVGERVRILGRMMQNSALCQKYKTKVVIGSFAKAPMEMRAPGDLAALFEEVGIANAKSHFMG